ncbi:MAG: cellulase family glycosylhydrolase [Lachnospiraceae bacterium]
MKRKAAWAGVLILILSLFCGGQAFAAKIVVPQGLILTIRQVNSWQEGGQTWYQYQAELENQSGTDCDSWSFSLDAGEKVTVRDHWNCEIKRKGTVLSFTPADWNGSLPDQGRVTDIGWICTAKTAPFAEGSWPVQPSSDRADSGNTKTSSVKSDKSSSTPYAQHGKLSVQGTDLVDAKGKPFQLKGVSTHGLAWYPQYVNKGAFQYLRDEWGANLIRLALYPAGSGGYCTGGDRKALEKTIDKGVKAATDLGMYVIIDWHVLEEKTPLRYEKEALDFFDRMSAKYGNNAEVLYEICNEPNGDTTWDEIRAYAEDVIPVIRKNAPDAIILVGTPTWSQDVDQVAKSPIEDGGNVMYTMHFYAATHGAALRQKLVRAHNAAVPVFISECSVCEASGDGKIDLASAAKWEKLIRQYNLSYAGWSLCNKDEAAALLRPSVKRTDGGWKASDLTESAKALRDMMQGS